MNRSFLNRLMGRTGKQRRAHDRRRNLLGGVDALESRQLMDASPWWNSMNPADVNNDGVVTSLDVQAVTTTISDSGNSSVQVFAGTHPSNGGLPDVTNDWWVNQADVDYINNVIGTGGGGGSGSGSGASSGSGTASGSGSGSSSGSGSGSSSGSGSGSSSGSGSTSGSSSGTVYTITTYYSAGIEDNGLNSPNTIYPSVSISPIPAPGQQVTVLFHTTGAGTAGSNDYTACSGSHTFTNSTYMYQGPDICIALTADSTPEPDETIGVEFSFGSGTGGTGTSGSFTISDNDGYGGGGGSGSGTGSGSGSDSGCACENSTYVASLPPPTFPAGSPFQSTPYEQHDAASDADEFIDGPWMDPGDGLGGDPDNPLSTLGADPPTADELPDTFKWTQIKDGQQEPGESSYVEKLPDTKAFGETRAQTGSAKFNLEVKMVDGKCVIAVKDSYVPMQMDIARFVKDLPVPVAQLQETINHERIHAEKRLAVLHSLESWTATFNTIISGYEGDDRARAADIIVKEVNKVATTWVVNRLTVESTRQRFHFDHKSFKIREMGLDGVIVQSKNPANGKLITYADNFTANVTFMNNLIAAGKGLATVPATVATVPAAENIINAYGAAMDQQINDFMNKVVDKVCPLPPP